MGVNKKHDEFHTLDMNVGWETPPGYPKGIEQKILSGALDETNKRGTRTRLLRFAPGVFTKKPFVHDYWEEVFLVSGDLTVGNDAQRNRRQVIPAQHLCCPPARCPSRALQVERRLHTPGNPLLRPGLSDAGEVSGARLLLLDLHHALIVSLSL